MKTLALFLAAAFLVTIAGASANLNNSVVAYWALDGSVSDSSGNARSLTAESGSNYDTGKIRQGGNISTSTTTFSRADEAALRPNQITISSWVRYNQIIGAANYPSIVDRLTTSSDGYRFLFNGDTGKWYFGVAVSGTEHTAVSTTTPLNNTWYHIVATYDGETLRVYVNGVQEGANTAPSGNIQYSAGSTALGVGRRYFGTAWTTNGTMDEVAIWSRALNATEVGQLYNGGLGNNFYNPISTTLTINASNSYNGSIITTFNASVTWNGTTTDYTTTNGTIITTSIVNSTFPANVTVNAANYFSFTVTGVTGTTLQANLTQAVAGFRATEIITGNNVTNFTVCAPLQCATGSNPTLNLSAGNYSVNFSAPGWFTQNFTISVGALTSQNYTLSGVHQYRLNITAQSVGNGTRDPVFAATVTSGLFNYSFTGTTNTTNITIPWTNDTNINISIYNASFLSATSRLYNTSNHTGSLPVLLNVTISSFTTNTINFIIFSEQNNTIINTSTINVFVTGTINSYNYTTTNGILNTTILTPDTYVITYGGSGWTQRQVIYTLINQTYNIIPLYLLSSSSSFVIETFYQNQNFQHLQGTNVTLLKKNLSGTNYYTVYGCVADANGRCVMNVEIPSTTYRITYSYNDFTGSSGDIQFTINDVTTGRTFFINTVNNTLAPTFQWNTLGQTAAISFQRTNNTYNGIVRFTVNNPSLVASNACLYVYSQVGLTRNLLNSGCTTASSVVSLDVFANASGSDSLYAQGYVTVSGVEYLIAQNSFQTNTSDLNQAGRRLSLWAVVIAVSLTMVLMFTWNPIAPPFIIGIVLYVFASVGLLYIPVGAVVSLIIMAFIMVLVMGKKT